MKIQLLSDLHLEFWMCRSSKIPPILKLHPEADVLVLAGDIISGSDDDFRRAYDWIAQLVSSSPKTTKPAVILVSGNHEHYGRILSNSLAFQHQLASKFGFYFLENQSVAINDVRFFGATLWTDYELDGLEKSAQTKNLADETLSDSRCIIDDSQEFLLATAYARINHHSRQMIELFLRNRLEYKKVMITHHGVSRQSVHQKYADDQLNGAFSSALLESLRASGVPLPKIWLHGHTHSSLNYNFSSECAVHVNPAGYPRFQGNSFSLENSEFNDILLIEI